MTKEESILRNAPELYDFVLDCAADTFGTIPDAFKVQAQRLVDNIQGKTVTTPPSMTFFPWDINVTHFTPTWDEIKGKAKMYRMARLRETGECVNVELKCEDCFSCYRSKDSFIGYKSTKDLCAFVL